MKNIETECAPAAIGPYSQAYTANGFLFTSGQVALLPGSGEIAGTTIEEQAEQCCKNIAAILDASSWVKEQGVRLIPQPMTRLGFLSNRLDDSGYAIKDEVLVKDGGRIYPVLLVTAGASRAPLSCAQIYADRILLEKRDPLLPEYLDLLIKSFSRRLEGMDRASEEVRIDLYDHARLALEGFRKMKKETEKW